jgi:hypothetical protein
MFQIMRRFLYGKRVIDERTYSNLAPNRFQTTHTLAVFFGPQEYESFYSAYPRQTLNNTIHYSVICSNRGSVY